MPKVALRGYSGAVDITTPASTDSGRSRRASLTVRIQPGRSGWEAACVVRVAQLWYTWRIARRELTLATYWI